jgi:cysteinyl-tRNA synthetase
MPGAVALVREILRASLPGEERRWLVLDADLVLGLDLHRVWASAAVASATLVPDVVSARLAERTAARRARDFGRADVIRDELSALGWNIIDEPGGSHVERREDTP